MKKLVFIVLGPFRMALFSELWNAGRHSLDNLEFGPACAKPLRRRQVQSSPREPSLRAQFFFLNVFDFFDIEAKRGDLKSEVSSEDCTGRPLSLAHF